MQNNRIKQEVAVVTRVNNIMGVVRAVVVAMLVAVSGVAVAQENTMNVYSNYSMYGLGELQTQGTLATRSLGGAGVAMRSLSSINLLNPASYSSALSKGVLFNYGLEGGQYSREQGAKSNSYTSYNFHNFALQIPLSRGIGAALSVTPYSSVGYKFSETETIPNLGYAIHTNEGSGDITEAKLGAGWNITKRLAVGVAAQYYWGTIDRTFASNIYTVTSSATAISPVGNDQLSVSKIKGQLGFQYLAMEDEKRTLSVGATYDIGGDLRPRSVRTVVATDNTYDIYAQNDTTKISIVLPQQISVGVQYATTKLRVAMDYTYQAWGNANDNYAEYSSENLAVRYHNVSTIKAGVEYIPRRGDIRKYYNRINYRAGLRYGGYQYSFNGESLSQMAVTAGFGFPIDMLGLSKIDLGLEWGSMGSTKSIKGTDVGLVKQNYFKVALGFTMFGSDYWFQRPQID